MDPVPDAGQNALAEEGPTETPGGENSAGAPRWVDFGDNWDEYLRLLDRARYPRSHPYRNTSLEEPSLPPPTEPPWARVERTTELMEDEAAQAELPTPAERAARREETGHLAEANASADRYSDALTEHYTKEAALQDAFETGLRDFQQSDPTGYAAFRKHVINAHLCSPTEVRQHEIIRWFRAAPVAVQDANDVLAKHYRREAKLRLQLYQAEQNTLSGGIVLHEHEFYAAYRTAKSPFGSENSQEREAFEEYLPEFDGHLQLRHMLANFEARKVRITHAAAGSRFPDRPWERSLDKSMLVFILSAFDQLDKFLNGLVEGVDEDDDRVFDLRSDMDDFQTELQDRKNEIDRLINDKGQAEDAFKQLQQRLMTEEDDLERMPLNVQITQEEVNVEECKRSLEDELKKTREVDD